MVDDTLPQERCDFYVYVIFRPSGEPCYVGKGKGNRWKQHAKHSYNPNLKRIYANAGGDLPIIKFRDGLTDAEAIVLEMALIAAIGRKKDGGPLVNLTDGGDGPIGMVLSAESRAKIGKAHTGKTLSE